MALNAPSLAQHRRDVAVVACLGAVEDRLELDRHQVVDGRDQEHTIRRLRG
jgi:hypothetical protein